MKISRTLGTLAAGSAFIAGVAFASGTVCPDGHWSPTGFCEMIPKFAPCGVEVPLHQCCPPNAMCKEDLPPCIDGPFAMPNSVRQALQEHGFHVPSWHQPRPDVLPQSPDDDVRSIELIEAMAHCLNDGKCQAVHSTNMEGILPICKIVCDKNEHLGPNCRLECNWHF